MTRRGPSRRGDAPAPESRTLVIVAVASLGAGLMAFVLGMHYGLDRSAEEGAPAAAREGVLGRLDREAGQLREVQARQRTQLSFHDTLAGPAKQHTPVAKPAVAKPAVEAAAAVLKTTPAEPAPGPADEPSPASVATADPADQAEPADAEQVLAQRDADLDAEDEEEDLEVASGPEHFSLQVGAFPDSVAAQGLVERLADKGYLVRIASAEVAGQGTWYRVRVGNFDDRDQAEQERAKIASAEGLFALVVPEG